MAMLTGFARSAGLSWARTAVDVARYRHATGRRVRSRSSRRAEKRVVKGHLHDKERPFKGRLWSRLLAPRQEMSEGAHRLQVGQSDAPSFGTGWRATGAIWPCGDGAKPRLASSLLAGLRILLGADRGRTTRTRWPRSISVDSLGAMSPCSCRKLAGRRSLLALFLAVGATPALPQVIQQPINPPLGSNAVTAEASARRALERAGYRDIRGLRPNSDGTWTGVASRRNVERTVTIDSHGNIVER